MLTSISPTCPVPLQKYFQLGILLSNATQGTSVRSKRPNVLVERRCEDVACIESVDGIATVAGPVGASTHVDAAWSSLREGVCGRGSGGGESGGDGEDGSEGGGGDVLHFGGVFVGSGKRGEVVGGGCLK